MTDYKKLLPKSARKDLAPLGRFLHDHQETEQKRLARHLESKRYREIVRDWGEFLGNRSGGPSADAQRPIGEVATERITLRFGKVVRKGSGVDSSTSPETLHRLRIDCKKLRYLLEFFKSIYDRSGVESLVRSLKGLQDNLGDFNDLQVQQETLMRYSQQMLGEGTGTAESLVAMGRLIEQLAIRRTEERERFKRRFARFASPEHITWVEGLSASLQKKAP
jgi:CHAD domain-containing protein